MVEANELRVKPPDEHHVKWTNYAVDKNLVLSVAISVFQEAADRAVVMDDRLTLNQAKVKLKEVAVQLKGAALASRDAAVMEYRLLANMVMQHFLQLTFSAGIAAECVRGERPLYSFS